MQHEQNQNPNPNPNRRLPQGSSFEPEIPGGVPGPHNLHEPEQLFRNGSREHTGAGGAIGHRRQMPASGQLADMVHAGAKEKLKET